MVLVARGFAEQSSWEILAQVCFASRASAPPHLSQTFPLPLLQLKQLRRAATEEQEALESRAASLAAELAAARQEAAAAQAAVAERDVAVQEESRAALNLASELVAAQQQLTAAEARVQELETAQRSVDAEVGSFPLAASADRQMPRSRCSEGVVGHCMQRLRHLPLRIMPAR